jgi:hypothetical protein
MLARALVAGGHAVRGTTRDPDRVAGIEAAGAEGVVADPDRVGTLIPAFDHVSVAVLLLGSVRATPEATAELHGPRLGMLLTRLIDTTVHGVLYEARGSVASEVLQAGAAQVRSFQERSRARVGFLEADPTNPEVWLEQALSAVETVLAPG